MQNSPVPGAKSEFDGGSNVGVVPRPPSSLGGATLPWYWTDDLARVLLADGRISETVAAELTAVPVAYRREETTVEAAASALLEDDEIPLAA